MITTRPRILFVDDEQPILNALRRMFRHGEYEVETASSGEAGLEVFRRFRPAVVISDSLMPGMNGAEFLTHVREIDADPVRVVLTGCTEVGAAEAAINQGEVWRYITKPWNDEDLRATVAGAVDRFRLVRENRILSDKLAAIGLLVSGVAHELNNPLGGVLGYAQILRQEAPADSSLGRDLRQIEEAARRAKTIVADLLTFARSSRGAALAPAAIEEVAERAITLARFQLPQGVEIKTDFGASLAPVLVESNRLQQVILNLLSNAIQAISGSGARPGTILVRTRGAGDGVSLSVRDDGPGIAPEILGKIFDPFFTTKPSGVGTGLGLTVSQGIVHEFGGRLDVESEPGHGTEFTVTLPAHHVAGDTGSATVAAGVH